jgi:hypothetical protein
MVIPGRNLAVHHVGKNACGQCKQKKWYRSHGRHQRQKKRHRGEDIHHPCCRRIVRRHPCPEDYAGDHSRLNTGFRKTVKVEVLIIVFTDARLPEDVAEAALLP